MERDPCPWRLVDDAGGGFTIGLVGGSIWHFIGGMRNAPKGYRLSQAITRVQVRVPTTAGAFAVWGVIFSCFDCTFVAIRKKEDPWNAIMSGAATGGFLAMRAGLRSMATNAMFGGLILAAMEGLGVAFQRVLVPWMGKKFNPAAAGQIDLLNPPVDPKRRRTYNMLYDKSNLMSLNKGPGTDYSENPDPNQSSKSNWKLW